MSPFRATVLVCALFSLTCSRSSQTPAVAPQAAQKKTLHFYTWADYIKPEIVERFEKEFQCEVVIDTFDSNEAMYAKLSSGATGYDLITPSSYQVQVMARNGLLQDLQRQLLPNLDHVDGDYLRQAFDQEMKFSVPYMISYTGVGYLKSKVPEPMLSWSLFGDAGFKGRATMLNDMRETIGAALKFKGHSLNSVDDAELEEARKTVIEWKANLAKFENEQYKNGIASGEFTLVMGYSGDLLQVQADNEDVGFFLPQEGFSIACDDLVIPKTAQNVELAHAFINFLHEPATAAENTEFVSYLCPNQASYLLLSEETRSNPAIFPSPELRARGEVLRDLGSDLTKYIQIWDQIKGAE